MTIPTTGYYDRVGPTENEILNTYLRGEIYLPCGIEMTHDHGLRAATTG